MGRQVLAVFACIAFVCSGCSYVEEPSPPATISAPVPAEPEELGSGVEIPSSYDPPGRNDIEVRRVQNVFSSVPSLRQAEYFSASQLQAVASRADFSSVVVSGCDLEVLRVFIASDWIPVVVMQSPVGPKHIRALVGYDDSTERLVLIDPVNYAEMRLGYSEFSEQWTDPQDACLLIFPQRVVLEDTIKAVLTRYLPEEKVESISIRVPKRR